jgi:hypothetical protein
LCRAFSSGEGVTRSAAACSPGSSRLLGPGYTLVRSDLRRFIGSFAAVAAVRISVTNAYYRPEPDIGVIWNF